MLTCTVSDFTSVESTRGDKRANNERVTKSEQDIPSLYEVETGLGREIAECYVIQYSSHMTATAIYLLLIHSFIRLEIRHIYSMTTVVMKDERIQILNILMNHSRRPEYI